MDSGLEKVISNQPLKLLFENRVLPLDLGAGTEYEAQVYCEKLRSSYLLEEAKGFEQQLFHAGVEFSRLKGSYLIQCGVFTEGKRTFSDLDYLISPKHIEDVKSLLLARGYAPHLQKKWKANANRHAYFKKEKSGLLLSIDIHTSLFWNQPEDYYFNHNVDISPEDHFLYMIYNYSVQDNFVGFYKLYDLHAFYKSHNDNLDVDAILNSADDYGIRRACQVCFCLLNQSFNTGVVAADISTLEKWIVGQLLTDSFLFSPSKFKLKYVLLKFLMKDSILESLEYQFRWVMAYLPGLLRGLIRI